MGDPYKDGLEDIRTGRFFEAHEQLELVWRAAPILAAAPGRRKQKGARGRDPKARPRAPAQEEWGG